MMMAEHLEDKTRYCKEYFEDMKPKYLKPFKAETPQGNMINGFICKKPNRFLGSLVITRVNDESVEQFVHGFPKIHYWDKYHQLISGCYATVKLDGSCIGVYALQDKEGNVMELVPKSRNLPVADKNLLSMYNLCDLGSIKEYFTDSYHKDNVLFFELYGVKNHHTIRHYDTYIDLALIGCYSRHFNEFLDYRKLISLHFHNGLSMCSAYFFIGENEANQEINVVVMNEFERKFRHYLSNLKESYTVPTVYDGVRLVQDLLQELNTNYSKENGRFCLEGVVFNGWDTRNADQLYIKVKPHDIEESARSSGLIENGLGRKYIIKEVYKFFDEYDSEAKDLYVNNPSFIWDYVMDGLKEEFSPSVVEHPKTVKRIEKVFLDVANSKEVPESINNIALSLRERYPDESISGLMRLFASENPYRKKDSRLVYAVLEKIMR